MTNSTGHEEGAKPSAVKRVVIVGGGFGGVYTARALCSLASQGALEVTLVSSRNYFLFTPLLHEVATGGLSPESVAEPLREYFRDRGVSIVEDTVTRVDTALSVVCGKQGTYPYDYLVLSTGAVTNYFSIPGAQEHTIALKDLTDAMTIRRGIIVAFEKAAATRDREERKKILSFIVVGAGATGVELATEMAAFVRGTLAHYYCGAGIQCEDISVKLISTTDSVLTPFHPTVQTVALRTLSKLGVILVKNARVVSVQKEGVTVDSGAVLSATMVVWAAGVSAHLPAHMPDFKLNRTSRVVVDENLRVPTHSNIFVIGDAAAAFGSGGEEYPLLAQIAVRQAVSVAGTIKAIISGKNLVPFRYTLQGKLVSLGQWMAAGEIRGIPFSGPHIWWLWRTVYLFTFLSWRKRFRIAMEWTINLLYPRDITKLDSSVR